MQQEIEAISQQLGQVLLAKGWRVATAESCTGGWVAEAITSVAGSSGWFGYGYVAYANEAKQQMLGVKAETLTQSGVVSEAVVIEMANGARYNADATLAVAISGIAGPDGGSPEKPVGTVWLAWSQEGRSTQTQGCHFSGDRFSVRQQAVVMALSGLLRLAEHHEG
ncbi:MAG: nicotinamide-nucleotide amidohydrolase family protein [Endozoicomonadaceae bacterium]|nr:nicotinamide-nucleotide amidohydrolase family protein [Endozoicomonadaceae bacterium]